MPAPRPHGDRLDSPQRRRLLAALGIGAANLVVLNRLQGGSSGAPTAQPTVDPHRPPAGPADPGAIEGAAAAPGPEHTFDRVITGGRVIDPDSGFDGPATVGIDGSTITAVVPVADDGDQRSLVGRATIDATGLVVSPGFIDQISYKPGEHGIWAKVADGVTTNLGMHGMLETAEAFFTEFERVGSPCHYGGAYDSQHMRGIGGPGIDSGRAATADELRWLVDDIGKQLDRGWIGVAFAPEYTPGITTEEIERQAEVAAAAKVPCYFHGRYSTNVPPDDNAKTLSEILEVGTRTGAAVHVMHINSTGGTFEMDTALRRLADARNGGIDVTCCVYPYLFWATYIKSARFADGWQERFHITYEDLVVPGTGERLTRDSFNRYRNGRDNKLVAAYAMPEADLLTALGDPSVMVGSDAILEPGNNNHPRATGCFSRVLGSYVRERQALSLPAALAKMTSLPARRLEAGAPAMRRKGRIQRGADADVVVFDPATVTDRSTVDNPELHSVGMRWVLVDGQPVLTPEGFTTARPGRPITRSA